MPDLQRRTALREVPDESLMQKYANGDAGAFEELFRRYEPRAFYFFIKRTRSRERAEDLYQELFLRIHRARDAYDPNRAFTPWFFQIAHRLLVDDQRRAYRSHELPIGDRETHPGRVSGRDDVADREQVGQILDGLSPEERYVLVSAKAEGIGYSELAAHLDKSVDAVKKLASRAMQRVRAAPLPAAASLGQRNR
jgi:RNA polymerase sigma-70 factor (ECF subfamily)